MSDANKNVRAPNVFERAKEEIEAVFHTHHHHKESHGMRNDIDETTPLNDVKAPNVFERAKEEIEAIVDAIHRKKESPTHEHETRDQSTKAELDSKKQENNAKAPNLIERVKEEIEAITHHDKSPHRHDKETHGRSDDIDENTAIDEVRGPSVFQRAKEEIEALVETIHLKEESNDTVSSPKENGGFGCSLGMGLERVCSPWGTKRD